MLDGSNFYKRLKEKPLSLRNLLEFNYGAFVNWLGGENFIAGSCYYVGAVRTEKDNPKSFKLLKYQHHLFSRLKSHGVKTSLGYILKTDGYHEKGVDVQIAVDLLIGAYENLWDKVILVSSDTDLLPAIRKARELGKTVEYVGFSHKPSFALIRYASLSKLLSREDLLPFAGKEAFRKAAR